MNTYCVKCEKDTENIDSKKIIDFIMMIMMVIMNIMMIFMIIGMFN